MPKAGTIAGQISIGDPTWLAKYNGLAPLAKLAIYDLGAQLEERTTLSTFTEYYRRSYRDSEARISSNSWGTQAPTGYDSFAQLTDDFLSDHPDFLLVFSAGNNGCSASKMQLSSPGVAKNVLTVGATFANFDSFTDKRSGNGLQLLNPSETIALKLHDLTRAALNRLPSDPVLAMWVDGAQGQSCRVQSGFGLAGRVAVVEANQRSEECSWGQLARQAADAGAITLLLLKSENVAGPLICWDDNNMSLQNLPIAIGSLSALGSQSLRTRLQSQSTVQMFFPVALADASPDRFVDSNVIAGDSSRGPLPDGRFKPDVLAPGFVVYSAAADGDLNSFQCNQVPGEFRNDGVIVLDC